MGLDERFARYRFRMVSAGLVVLLITGCGTSGGDGDDDTSPTATATVWPTVNDSVKAPSSPNAVEPWQISGSPTAATAVTPQAGASTTSSPASVASATVATQPTAPAQANGTPVEPSGNASPAATTAAGSAPTATTATGATTGAADNTPVVHEANPSTGDGTGANAGSESAGTPSASPGASPAASPGAVMMVSSCDVPDAPAFTGSDSAYITTSEVNIRIGPGTDCDPAAEILAQGTLLEVTSDPVQREDQDGTTWVRVSVDGIEGWVSTEFIAHDS